MQNHRTIRMQNIIVEQPLLIDNSPAIAIINVSDSQTSFQFSNPKYDLSVLLRRSLDI